MFRFPNPVNEVSARLVAAGVAVLAGATLVTRWEWLLVVLAYGFVARVLTGPRLSPLALVVTRWVTPRLGVHGPLVPGPPKRFAQGIGATLSVAALVAAYGFGRPGVAWALVAAVLIAATLESVFAVCLGCVAFAALMRVGVIPESVCRECADLSRHVPGGA